MKKTWLPSLTLIAITMMSGSAYANQISGAVGSANNAVGSGQNTANSAIDKANSSLFGLIDSFAPGGGEPGSGTATALSSTPAEGATTLLAGGRMGVNPYTVNCDTSQFASAVAESVAKVNYRTSLSSNICGVGGLSRLNLTDLMGLGGGLLQKAFCSAVKMVADPVIAEANAVIDQAEGLTGIDYFNQKVKEAESLADVSNAMDAFNSSGSSSGGSSYANNYAPSPAANSAGNSVGGPASNAVPKNMLTEISWADIGTTRSINLDANDVLSARFTVPANANNISGNFNVGGMGSRNVTISPTRGAMTDANASCVLNGSGNATVRFVTGAPQFGRCSLVPGQMYYLNVQQGATAGKATVRLFHN